jgi:hypothetical protein
MLPGRHMAGDRAVRCGFDSHGGSAEDHREHREGGSHRQRLARCTEGLIRLIVLGGAAPIGDKPVVAALQAANQT